MLHLCTKWQNVFFDELSESKTKRIGVLLRTRDYSLDLLIIKNGRIEVKDYSKKKIYSIPVIKLVDCLKIHGFKNSLPNIYPFLKSVKNELEKRSKDFNVFSEAFDDLSGVTRTRNYEQKEVLKNEMVETLNFDESEINDLVSLWGNCNCYELYRDLKSNVVPDLEFFLSNSGLSKNIVENLIKFQSIPCSMKPLKIWLLVQLLLLWNPKDFHKEQFYFDSFIMSMSNLNEDEIVHIIKYVLKNKTIFKSDFKKNVKIIAMLIKLNIPISVLKKLDLDEINKLSRFDDEINNQFDGFEIVKGLGYSLANTENVDYHEILKKTNSLQNFFFLCGTSANEEEFVKEHSQFESTEEIAKHYVVHKDQWGEKFYNTDQIAYGNNLHAGVLVGAAALKENRWDFTQLLNFLAYHRFTIAKQSKAVFGLFHCLTGKTHLATGCDIGDAYEELGKRLEEHMKIWEQEGAEGYNPETRAIEIELDGKKIQLSRFRCDDQYTFHVQHPLFTNIPKVLNHVEKIYQECLVETDREELLEKLGQIFWLICQAKPWLRGDPSIAEMFIKVVWMHKTGELLPSWKQGVVPWESVIESTNPKDYGKNFRCLFSHSPY